MQTIFFLVRQRQPHTQKGTGTSPKVERFGDVVDVDGWVTGDLRSESNPPDMIPSANRNKPHRCPIISTASVPEQNKNKNKKTGNHAPQTKDNEQA
jgi:hypothetical protein